MVIFACAGCSAVLTARVSRVELPDHARQSWGDRKLPSLLEPGTYAVDPKPSFPPYRLWDEVGAEEAEARGVYAPVYSLPYGPSGRIGVAPGDLRGTVHILRRDDNSCCGLSGSAGPNLACAECGRAVATLIDDCYLWYVAWLDPDAVRPVSVSGPACRVIGWESLREEFPGIPPVAEPGWWSLEWRAAVAVSLAHLLAASGGKPMVVPDGLVGQVFRGAIDRLLPAGPPERRLVLAGPGLAAASGDVLLVPRHPQTGRVWPSGAEAVVPLAAEVWTYLAFHDDRRLLPAANRIPADVRRDDPPPLLPHDRFRPDWQVFRDTLARLPAVRRPWLRAIYDRAAAL
ncbi:hypothetical protein ACIBI9_28850 [Nonomuraea sp. NPDC050451]|uniref:hypothetical protein n=1 Tax=Nonomuraea sp. NPDC050451 TaxID=3364364 RepID=UPI0037B662DB